MSLAPGDVEAIGEQLGRPARGVRAVPYRCPSGHPGVIETHPRLPDGTPFPTLYYVTCPVLTAATSTLESRGLMQEMTAALRTDDALAAQYRSAHEAYLRAREQIALVAEISGVSAGGMPDRVKCLHVLVAHSLATVVGVNPLGDRAIEALRANAQHQRCLRGLPGRTETEAG